MGADENVPVDRARSGLDAAQVLLRSYDEVGWQLGESSHEKLRHLCLHLAKTVGAIASLSEKFDHQSAQGDPPAEEEVAEDLQVVAGQVADLASFAAQIATLADTPLGELFIQRLRENTERFAPDSEFARGLLGGAASEH